MNRTNLIPQRAIVLGAALTFFLSASVASAQSVGLELDLAIPTGDAAEVYDLGFGGQIRGGIGLPIPGITLIGEVIVDYYSLPVADFDVSATVLRYGAGIRAGVPIPFVPELFAHIGYGTASYDLNLGGELGTVEASTDGLTWDVGMAANLLPLPIIDLGIHVAYKVLVNSEDEGSDLTWVALGLHVGASF